jgi:hypothetical protein
MLTNATLGSNPNGTDLIDRQNTERTMRSEADKGRAEGTSPPTGFATNCRSWQNEMYQFQQST